MSCRRASCRREFGRNACTHSFVTRGACLRRARFAVGTCPSRSTPRQSSRAAVRSTTLATRRPKPKTRLKLRVASTTSTKGPGRRSDAQDRVRAAASEASLDAMTVHAVEIRPAGTVVNRRPLTKRPAILHLPHQPVVRRKPPAWMLEECHVAPARAGDQAEILQLLSGLPSPPSKAEFHAAVDHPDHDSANRLVARLAGRIVGHVEIVPRSVRLGTGTVQAAVLDRVAVLPECRGAGHGQRLVRAAEDRMRQMGAAVALSRTRIAPSFHELGWSVLGRDCATPGRPTTILSRLLEGPKRDGESSCRQSFGYSPKMRPASSGPSIAVRRIPGGW
jgi:GNAT superfamily N-acetyltransferase